MEALILAIIIAYAVKKAAEQSHGHWQGAKAANRKASKDKPVRQRAASAARHDTAYWAEQVRGGFPQVRHGLYMGWHAGRIAQLDGQEARAERQAEHAETRARVTEAVREQRRRQAEALERIRAAARQSEPEPGEPGTDPPPDDGSTPVTPSTEGTAMGEIQRNDTLANTGRSPGQFGGNGMSGDTTTPSRCANSRRSAATPRKPARTSPASG
jgi:hypothetical protein